MMIEKNIEKDITHLLFLNLTSFANKKTIG